MRFEVLMNKKLTYKFVSLMIAASIMICALGTVVSAAVSYNSSKSDFKYVALGASNVNGYGLHGYNFEGVYEAPFEKALDNRYGYKMDTPGSYPVLLKEKLDDGQITFEELQTQVLDIGSTITGGGSPQISQPQSSTGT